MKLKTLWICSLVSSLSVTGCASKTQLVYVPVKCEIVQPVRPIKSDNVVKDIVNILKYTELLEFNLNSCVNNGIIK